MVEREAPESQAERGGKPLFLFEDLSARPNQPVADMVFTLTARRSGGALYRPRGKIHLTHAGMGRENFNGPPILVPRLKIHAGIISGGVLPENFFNLARLIEKILPRDRGDQRKIGYRPSNTLGIVKRAGSLGLGCKGERLLDLAVQDGTERRH